MPEIEYQSDLNTLRFVLRPVVALGMHVLAMEPLQWRSQGENSTNVIVVQSDQVL